MRLTRGQAKEQARKESVKLSMAIEVERSFIAGERGNRAGSINTGQELDVLRAPLQRQVTYFEGKPIEPTNSRQFMRDIWPFVAIIGMNGLISKMVFPGLAIRLEISAMPYSWFVVSIITLVNVSSLVGRMLTAVWDASIGATFALALFRSMWWPVTLALTASNDPEM